MHLPCRPEREEGMFSRFGEIYRRTIAERKHTDAVLSLSAEETTNRGLRSAALLWILLRARLKIRPTPPS